MRPAWDYGDAVRITRNVRNDGTFPGIATGDLLVRRGSVGHVVNVGTFLVDQLIYSVHFLDAERIVGCRAEELIDAAQPWLASRFAARERVQAALALSSGGTLLVPAGACGEVVKLLCDDDRIVYHVHFECLPGRVFAVPESALATTGGDVD
jgi:nitrogen fixation protein NifZ